MHPGRVIPKITNNIKNEQILMTVISSNKIKQLVIEGPNFNA